MTFKNLRLNGSIWGLPTSIVIIYLLVYMEERVTQKFKDRKFSFKKSLKLRCFGKEFIGRLQSTLIIQQKPVGVPKLSEFVNNYLNFGCAKVE